MKQRAMKKIITLFFEYLGVYFVINLFGILLHQFISLNNIFTNLVYWLFRGIMIAAVVFTVRRIKDNWRLKDLGFQIHRSWGKDLWFGFLGFCVLYILLLPLELVNLPIYAKSISKFLDMFPDTSLPLLIVIMTLASLVFGFLSGAWHEEIWYRGYIQSLFSSKIAPAAGFFISFIPFGLVHHFSHPEYNDLLILNILLNGAMFCLVFYATRSLLASMTTHTLTNVITIYAPFVFMKGYTLLSYITALFIGLILLVFCFWGRKELKELWSKTKQMFSESKIIHCEIGLLIGLFVFLVACGQNAFADQYESNTLIIVYGTLGALFIGLSFIKTKKL